VPEARSASGELYGFARLTELTRQPALKIAEAARDYGQEDDITVLSIQLIDSKDSSQPASEHTEAIA